jgi:GTPase
VETVRVSATHGQGIDRLMSVIEKRLQCSAVRVRILLPYECGSLLNRIHTEGSVLQETFRDDGIFIEANVNPALVSLLDPFQKDC